MKESTGSTFIFFIILGFLAIFIVFIAIIMNFASAYRTNNYVVNLIEQYEGRYPYGNSNDTTPDTLVGYLKNSRYYEGLEVECSNIGPDSFNPVGAVFSVKTFIKFRIPIINLDMKLKIVNKSKTIYKISCTQKDGNPLPSIGNEWQGA